MGPNIFIKLWLISCSTSKSMSGIWNRSFGRSYYTNPSLLSRSSFSQSNFCLWLVPAQDIHCFYTRSHLGALENYALIFPLIFILFSHLHSALHDLVIELCIALKIFKNMIRLFSKVTRSFVDTELLTFFKNAKFHCFGSRELSVFWLNSLYSLSRKRYIKNIF